MNPYLSIAWQYFSFSPWGASATPRPPVIKYRVVGPPASLLGGIRPPNTPPNSRPAASMIH